MIRTFLRVQHSPELRLAAAAAASRSALCLWNSGTGAPSECTLGQPASPRTDQRACGCELWSRDFVPRLIDRMCLHVQQAEITRPGILWCFGLKVIVDICRRMGAGMAEFIEKDVVSIADYEK